MAGGRSGYSAGRATIQETESAAHQAHRKHKQELQEQQHLEERTRITSHKLKQAQEVNRVLVTALLQKKSEAEEIRRAIAELDDRIERTSLVDLPARARAVAQQERDIVSCSQSLQEAKLLMGKRLMEMEEEAESLVKTTADLREQGVRNRTLIKDQQWQVKELQRQVKEIRKHIDILEGSATPAQSRSAAQSEASYMSMVPGPSLSSQPTEAMKSAAAASAKVDSEDVASATASRTTAASRPKGNILMSIDEFQQLPGLDLQALLADGKGMGRQGSRRQFGTGGSVGGTLSGRTAGRINEQGVG